MSWGEEIPAQVVGLVGDVRLTELDTVPRGTLYWPQPQLPNSFMSVIVRGRDGRPPAASDLRARIASLDPELPLSSIRELPDVVAGSLGRPRLTLSLMSVFGGAALLLAAVGIYGVVAFSVGQRAHEFGLRMALGASSSDIGRLVLKQGLRLSLLGVVLGIATSLALSRLVESLLYEIGPRDPLTIIGIALVLVAVALVATLVPARRATRVDPFVILRTE
jgi:ABC-type antimicrobial peptide transport system permease subunit